MSWQAGLKKRQNQLFERRTVRSCTCNRWPSQLMLLWVIECMSVCRPPEFEILALVEMIQNEN